jgi:serine/alanine adding enzyme
MPNEIINPVVDHRWGGFIEGHPAGAIFQHPLYLGVLQRTYKHISPVCFIRTDASNEITAGMPFFMIRSKLTGNRLVSLPFASYSDPLVQSSPEFDSLLGDALSFFDKNALDYIEMKPIDGSCYLDSAEPLTPQRDQKTHILDLRPGREALYKNFDRTNIRQKISRAEKEGITVRPATSDRELHGFYSYLLRARKRLGLPPQYFGFFRKLWEALTPAGMMKMLRADLGGTPIGYLLYFKFKKKIYAEYIATDDSKFPLGVNQILFWSAIKEGIDEGFESFDFGKSYIDNSGLRAFKSRWGAAEIEAPTYFYPASRASASGKNNRRSYRILSSLYKKMPAPLALLSGRFLYRHMG